jgi:hypothetical protein
MGLEDFNYYGDRRVSGARGAQRLRAAADPRTMTIRFSHEDYDTGDVRNYTIPFHWAVCDVCGGRGTHVNPSIDAGGIGDDDEFWMDDVDEETGESRYFSGAYDVPCYTCGGRTTVPSAEPQTEEEREAFEAVFGRYSYSAEQLAEMRWGA